MVARSETCNGTVGREDAGRGEVALPTHGRHGGLDIEMVDIIGSVGLAHHAVHVSGERVELECEVEVREAVVGGHAVVVHPRLLLGDGHGVGPDLELAVEDDEHAVGRLGAGDGEGWHGGGGPRGVDAFREVDGLAVDGELHPVHVVVPRGGLPGAEVELVLAVEEHGDGLDPRKVAGGLVAAALADEVGVDVEVAVGDDAEVGVPAAVEEEGVAVAADEARVAARPGHAAHCNYHIAQFNQ
ncbi:hypothetical protein PR202_ga04008 [Eleusine coracana subsp. coracana]|uniref:Uncharacterized protein n=1 Tax=Eleusine coracana subsp. coracana TaxID=191504 RepID=A0AAV5BQ37_ELECO|nr:hypothetical protein PR202_ga04008 [Eleusine coracana subsp. coracana]